MSLCRKMLRQMFGFQKNQMKTVYTPIAIHMFVEFKMHISMMERSIYFFYSNSVCRLIHYSLVMLSSSNRKNFSFYSFSLILFERKVLCNFGKTEISISESHLSSLLFHDLTILWNIYWFGIRALCISIPC